jgi:response regulator of citrate/malate metabolism
LIWVDRNQLGRRNLTDSQRTEVIGRIYNTKKMAQGRPRKDEKEVKLTSFSGSDATAKEVAKEVGVSEATVRRAGKFAEAVAALEGS